MFKRDTTVPIHCIIPGAIDTDLSVDSNWINENGYQDPILKRNITVGSKEVIVYAKDLVHFADNEFRRNQISPIQFSPIPISSK